MPRISANRLNMEDGRIDRPILKDYGETLVGGSAGTNTTATYTCDIQNANVFNLILSANCTFTFSNPAPPGTQCTITIYLRQDGTGGRSVTWPSSVKWPGDVAPMVSTTAAAQDIFTFVTIDSGSTWLGAKSGENFKLGGGYLYQLWTWGDNSGGQIGQNTSVALDRSSPVQIGSDTNWAKVSVGGNHMAAIKSTGTLWAWGANSAGGLGTGDTNARSSPVQIGTLSNWTKVSAGLSHTAAVKQDGTLWAWGYSSDGRPGHNDTTQRNSPVQVGLASEWTDVSAGEINTGAIKNDGTLWMWGRNTTTGTVGDNAVISRSSPVQIGTLTNWALLSIGRYQSTAIKTNGTLWAWGGGGYGRTGLNSTTDISSPTQVGTLSDWAQLSTGNSHSVAIKTNGTLWTWGRGTQGRLGLNSTTDISSPTQVGTLTDWALASAGTEHTAAVKTNGTLWMWGDNSQGQLGESSAVTTDRSSPVQVGILTSWAVASAGLTRTSGFQNP